MSSNLKSASQKQDTAFLSYARDDDQRPLEKPKTRDSLVIFMISSSGN